MVIAILIIIGLALGSFVNALVWRVHEQANERDKTKPNKEYISELSISKGRSMCPECKHTLAAKDLLPVLSWVSTLGKCRYCKKAISRQYPVVEIATACLFVLSYYRWPEPVEGIQIAAFGLWLLLLTGLMALLVYDARWFLLPNRILYKLYPIGIALALIGLFTSDRPFSYAINSLLAVIVGGGIFWILYTVSKGKWIGYGDVRLGWLLGLVAATPARSMLVIFIASLAGVLVSLPLMKFKRLQKNSLIPFGPFLIIGLVVVQLYGKTIIDWYMHTVLQY